MIIGYQTVFCLGSRILFTYSLNQMVMRISFISIIILLLVVNISAQTKTNWSPQQCLQLKNISATIVSPDGSKMLYTVREAIMTDDRSEYINSVWVCNTDGTHHVQLSKGDKGASNPGWSPDGKWVSFTSSRDGKNNLYLLPLEGGEAEKITDVKSGILIYEWSHDGNSIAFTMTDAPSDKEEKNKKSKNDWYFMDEDIKQSHLYVVSTNHKDSSGKYLLKQITKEDYTVTSFSWSPNNQQIAYSYAKSPKANDGNYQDIAIIDIASGLVKTIAKTTAGESNPIYSPDGKLIVYYSTTDNVDWSGAKHAMIYSIADGKTWRLAATPNEDGNLIGWTPDSKQVFWTESNRTLSSIYLLGTDGKSISEWSKGATGLIGLTSLNSKGTHISFTLQNASQLPQAYISQLSNYAPIRQTNLNESYQTKALPKTELVTWKGADGKDIEGLLTYPLNYTPGNKVPLLLNVHGGPAGVFSQSCVAANSGTYPLASLAELGYAILRPNPRGSSGYGTEFRTGNRSDWGGKDFIDLMNGVDYLIKTGLADETKLGIMGWSYGGFMSSWTVGHTNRFKAASIGAPVVDLTLQNLTDDIPGFLPSYFNSQPWENWSLYNSHSPIEFVQNVTTPVLLQQCEGDQRVPISNGIMFYHALLRRNIPVRMLAMPRQAHGPIEPRMNLIVMQTNVEWFSKYIKP